MEVSKGTPQRITYAKYEYAFRVDKSELVSYVTVAGGPFKRVVRTSCRPGKEREKRKIVDALKRCSVW